MPETKILNLPDPTEQKLYEYMENPCVQNFRLNLKHLLLLYLACTTNQRSIPFGYLHQGYRGPLLDLLGSS